MEKETKERRDLLKVAVPMVLMTVFPRPAAGKTLTNMSGGGSIAPSGNTVNHLVALVDSTRRV